MAGAAADRNLLLGVIALQMDFITREALIAAMHAWVTNKATPLSQVLQDQGALSAARRSLLDALVEEHIKLHDGDPQKSLATLSSIGNMRDALSRIADPDLQASLPLVSAARQDPDDDPYRTVPQPSVGDSTSVGTRFRILRPHARGGLGQVSVALDQELDRPVALKEIQDRHADEPHSRARFVQEAEITGKLEHPGIIPVYGLGHYADGRPYYAMRFIKGDSLMEAIAGFHADESLKRDPSRRALRLRELLRRFQDVCNAIAYAHSRGVLHRDLKPGNIMLGPYGETLVVDWGLAKPLGQEEESARSTGLAEGPIRLSGLSGSRAETVRGSMVGTPAYASPEQVTGQLDLLKPASDVYSLGATLYTLLTGRTPVQGNDLPEVLRKVQKGEITPPRSLDPTIPKPLEAICLKAMSLKAEQRYETAEGLKADLERWLADEPVSAWREPFAMRARRWMRRHRTLVTSTAAVLVFGLAGLAGFAMVVTGKNRELDAKNLQLVDKNRELDASNQELDRQRQTAEDQRDRAVKAEQVARDEEAKTKKSEAETRAVLEFFQTKVLAAARPKDQKGGLGKDVSLRAAVDASESGIEKAFAAQPAVEASIRETLGASYSYLGEPALAIRQHERALALRRQALGPDHPDTLTALGDLASAYQDAGRLADALSLHEETLKRRKSTLGPDHPDTLAAMGNLALMYWDAGRLADSRSLHEETLKGEKAKLGPDHPNTLTSMNNLALAYWDTGRLADALPLLEEALKRRKATLGPDHPETLLSMDNLAGAYRDFGRLADALPLAEETLRRRRSVLGPDHPSTLFSMSNLAGAYHNAGRLAEALPLFGETLKRREAKLGSDHPSTLSSMNNLARAYQSAGRLAEALPLLEETLKRQKAKVGPDHPSTLVTMNNLALAYQDADRLAEALPLFEETLKRQKAKLGPDHPGTLISMKNLARAYLTAKPAAAEPLLREALAIREQKTPDDWVTFETRSLLGASLLGQKKYAEAEPFLLQGLEGMKAREAKIPDASKKNLAQAGARIIQLYDAWGKKDQAEEWRRKLGIKKAADTKTES